MQTIGFISGDTLDVFSCSKDLNIDLIKADYDQAKTQSLGAHRVLTFKDFFVRDYGAMYLTSIVLGVKLDTVIIRK